METSFGKVGANHCYMVHGNGTGSENRNEFCYYPIYSRYHSLPRVSLIISIGERVFRMGVELDQP